MKTIRPTDMTKCLTLALLPLLILAGCMTDSKPGENPSWQAVSSITQEEKVIFDMRKQGDTLILFTPYTAVFIDTARTVGFSHPFSRPFHGDGRDLFRASENFIVGIDTDTMLRISNRHMPLERLLLPRGNIHPDIDVFQGTRIASLSPRQFVTDVRLKDRTAAILILDLLIDRHDGWGPYLPDSSFRAEIVPIGHYLAEGFIEWIQEGISHYIVSTRQRTYRLSPGGELLPSNLDYDVADGFRRGDRIVAAVYNTRHQGFVTTADDGLTWEDLDFQVDGQIPCFGKCFSAREDGAVLYIGQQLWHFEWKGDQPVRLYELDNRGLEGSKITGVAAHNGKYYVATYSGLYAKDTSLTLVERK